MAPPSPKKNYDPFPEPKHIPDPTPLPILRKYVGTFRTAAADKTLTITLVKKMLYLTHVAPAPAPAPAAVKLKTEAEYVKQNSAARAEKPQPVKQGTHRVVKRTVQTRRTRGGIATRRIIGAAMAEEKKKNDTTTPSTPAVCETSDAAAQSETLINPTPTAANDKTTTPTIAAGKNNDEAEYSDAHVPVQTNTTTTPTPTSKPLSASAIAAKNKPPGPAMLFLAPSGIPQVRVSGGSHEEAGLNAGLQAVGQLVPGNTVVVFRIGGGEVQGVKVGGEMFGRVGK
jgi:hypothetical protein